MTRPLSNKTLAVLGLLRDLGEVTCQNVADEMRARTPCGSCQGTGDGDGNEWGDETRGHVYRAAGEPAATDDELEALYQAPSAGES